MRRPKTTLLLAAIVAVLLSPINALACACCSNPGHYFSGEVYLDEHPRSELQRIRVARTAYLYSTEAGIEEDSLGIERPNTSYSLTGAFVGNVWRLTFRSGTNTGTLELPLPNKIWNHSVDIHDGKVSPGGGPLLYKEWRLEGDIKGSGFFRNSTPAKYVLVLQGRGNSCDSAEDFGNWRLQVRGEKADYAFYGKLARRR
ncbi:MAG TPA: hypothetical protein VFY61_08820 [Pyrinomonadaceae bacterium]|nr:hypothetical protein [Pyrinomonadaceae bacterium]